MRDRSGSPLAGLGLSDEERKKLRRKRRAEKLKKKDPKKAKRVLNELLDDDEDLPPPQPTRNRGRPASLGSQRRKDWITVVGSDIVDLLDECETQESKLSDWEREFVDSVSDQVARKRGLTSRQYEKLQDVVDRLDERNY